MRDDRNNFMMIINDFLVDIITKMLDKLRPAHKAGFVYHTNKDAAQSIVGFTIPIMFFLIRHSWTAYLNTNTNYLIRYGNENLNRGLAETNDNARIELFNRANTFLNEAFERFAQQNPPHTSIWPRILFTLAVHRNNNILRHILVSQAETFYASNRHDLALARIGDLLNLRTGTFPPVYINPNPENLYETEEEGEGEGEEPGQNQVFT